MSNDLRRYIQIVEAPLADFDAFGDLDTEGSFRADDLRAIRNPKWRLKVQNAFKNVPQKLNVYVYNGPEGRVNVIAGNKYATDKVDARDLKNIDRLHGIRPMSVVSALIGKMPPDAQESITILLVENEGDARVALTPWILGHRIAHAILYVAQNEGSRGDPEITRRRGIFVDAMNTIIGDGMRILEASPRYKEQMAVSGGMERLNALAKIIAQFRSGRMGLLANPGEFGVESLTQYLIQGRIRFNRPEVDDAGRTQMDSEEGQLLAMTREVGLDNGRVDEFVDFMLMNDPDPERRMQFRRLRAKPEPTSTWVGYYTTGEVAFETANQERAEAKAERGYRIEEKKPSRAILKKWATYMERKAALVAMYSRWQQTGILRPTATDRLDTILSEAERIMNAQAHHILQACVGKALML